MTVRRWLPVVLKVRRAREDLAAQQVAVAQVDRQQAIAHAEAETERLQAMPMSDTETAQAFTATAAAIRAAAATHAAAYHRIAFVEQELQVSIEGLHAVARDRLSAQKLSERDAAQREQEALRASQRELDDLTVTRWGRNETA